MHAQGLSASLFVRERNKSADPTFDLRAVMLRCRSELFDWLITGDTTALFRLHRTQS